MSFLSDAFGFLFGGKSQKADWKQIEKLMEMQAELNRTNRHGYFSGWDWTENPDGTWTQSQTLKPGLDLAADRLLGRAQGQGYEPYQSPAQFSSLLDAKMANQMQRHGILDDEAMKSFSLKQDTFGQRAGNRQGGYWSLDASNYPPAVSPENPDVPPMVRPPPGGGPATEPYGGFRGGTGNGYYDYKARMRDR